MSFILELFLNFKGSLILSRASMVGDEGWLSRGEVSAKRDPLCALPDHWIHLRVSSPVCGLWTDNDKYKKNRGTSTFIHVFV